jgi:hypothetical protein
LIRAIRAIPVVAENTFEWLSGRRRRVRLYGLLGALALFVVGLAWAYEAAPNLGSKVHLWPLALLLVLSAPVGTVLNAIELHALSRIARGPMTFRTAIELTIYTSAANMLPIPGGAVTKLAGMKAHGVDYHSGSAMIILSFLAWGCFSFLGSAIALFYLGQTRVAVPFGGCGLLLLAICGLGFARYSNWMQVLVVAGVRTVYFGIEALRYMLALGVVGVSVSFLQSSTLALASFVGGAVVVAPQGLGVIEAAAALLGTIVGLSASLGFIAAAIGRVVRLVGLALITALFIAFETKRPGQLA